MKRCIKNVAAIVAESRTRFHFLQPLLIIVATSLPLQARYVRRCNVWCNCSYNVIVRATIYPKHYTIERRLLWGKQRDSRITIKLALIWFHYYTGYTPSSTKKSNDDHGSKTQICPRCKTLESKTSQQEFQIP